MSISGEEKGTNYVRCIILLCMHTGICCVKLNVAAVRQVAIDFGDFNGNFNTPEIGWPAREIYKMQLNAN